MNQKPILALNAFDREGALDLGPRLTSRVAERAALFGAASVLFYDRPLEIVRGEGARVYDADGAMYLDAYNNVPSVGHCHPHVVAAASRQLRELNIHNRYLHPLTAGYARRMLATLPTALANITFTCTGSESNDLALRLATNFTGARGIIVTESAYHGNTALVTDASPTLVRSGKIAPFVRVVPPPDTFRQGAAHVSGSFAAHVAAAISDLEESGEGFAALLVDSIFSSDGVFPDPPGFLQSAVETAHLAGGLFIADEVQSGFGRTGASLWGFERHGVLPDVVTMGKPMGNGYPIGAVAMRPELLEAFCARYGYFNTFGGSPVAAAVGGAVLDVIEREDLIGNAARVGGALKQSLLDLVARHPAIVDVRGAGFYIGVELAQPGTAEPDPVLAGRTINGLRDRGVLIGAAGRVGNVLKIRPPLCFSAADAAELVAKLDDVLAQLARSG